MTRILIVSTALAFLAACGDTALERGVTGAAIGGGTAAAVGGEPVAGAALGAGYGIASN